MLRSIPNLEGEVALPQGGGALNWAVPDFLSLDFQA